MLGAKAFGPISIARYNCSATNVAVEDLRTHDRHPKSISSHAFSGRVVLKQVLIEPQGTQKILETR